MNIIDTTLTAINPYLLYVKIVAIALLAGGLIWAGIWFRGVLADRDQLQANAETMAANITAANHRAELAEAANRQYQQTIKEIVDAIKAIKINSHNYINTIETAPAPAVPDGDAVLLVPGGVPSAPAAGALPALFGTYSANRTAAGAAQDRGHQAR